MTPLLVQAFWVGLFSRTPPLSIHCDKILEFDISNFSTHESIVVRIGDVRSM